jgi:hypothetical protein
MRLHFTLILSILLSLGILSHSLAAPASNKNVATPTDSEWVPLFDGKTLDGWYTNLQKHKKNEDPSKVFQVHNGVIHVYKDQAIDENVTYGCLTTDREYAYFHLRLEYKWGDKKFRPRAEQRRDTGLLYHVIGANVVWPRCIECQIQENDVGDCFTVRGTQVISTVEMAKIETPGGLKMLPRFKLKEQGGKAQRIGDGSIARIVKSSTHEHDGWNNVEVIVRGDQEVVHIVNGHTVFQATDLRQLEPDKKNWAPLMHGRIALQAEFAEVYYRNIEIRPIPDGPLSPKPKQ